MNENEINWLQKTLFELQLMLAQFRALPAYSRVERFGKREERLFEIVSDLTHACTSLRALLDDYTESAIQPSPDPQE